MAVWVFLLALVVIGFFVGGFTTAKGQIIGWVILIISDFYLWNEMSRGVPTDFYRTYPELRGEKLIDLCILLISTSAAYGLGCWFGRIGTREAAKTNKAKLDAIDESLKAVPPTTIVDEIDRSLGCLIGTTHAWAQANWNSLSYADKVAWVSARQPHMAGLAHIPDTSAMINFLQKVDHFHRHGGTSAATDSAEAQAARPA